jgi:hypothetical protein
MKSSVAFNVAPIVFGLQAYRHALSGITKKPETLAVHEVSGLSWTV